MITLLIVAAVFAGLVFVVGEVVSNDGYGSRPAPRSQFDLFSNSHNRLV